MLSFRVVCPKKAWGLCGAALFKDCSYDDLQCLAKLELVYITQSCCHLPLFHKRRSPSDNPAGPPSLCGHRYHAYCLHLGVEQCRSKCIEPSYPYGRSPSQEI